MCLMASADSQLQHACKKFLINKEIRFKSPWKDKKNCCLPLASQYFALYFLQKATVILIGKWETMCLMASADSQLQHACKKFLINKEIRFKSPWKDKKIAVCPCESIFCFIFFTKNNACTYRKMENYVFNGICRFPATACMQKKSGK